MFFEKEELLLHVLPTPRVTVLYITALICVIAKIQETYQLAIHMRGDFVARHNWVALHQ